MHPRDIRRRLDPAAQWRLICLDAVGSTNDVARRAGDLGFTGRLAVFADVQLAGRGQRGRRWEAPPGRAVLCSTLWRPSVAPASAATLAQAGAVAVVRAMQRCGVAVRLKWPNDVLIGDAKCGGILIESGVEGDRLAYAVVGIGCNTLQGADELPATDYPATSVYLATGRRLDRVTFAAELLGALSESYVDWLTNRASVFDAWRDALVTLGREVEVVRGSERVAGHALDVEADGTLLVGLADGQVVRLVSGEVSIRG